MCNKCKILFLVRFKNDIEKEDIVWFNELSDDIGIILPLNPPPKGEEVQTYFLV